MIDIEPYTRREFGNWIPSKIQSILVWKRNRRYIRVIASRLAVRRMVPLRMRRRIGKRMSRLEWRAYH